MAVHVFNMYKFLHDVTPCVTIIRLSSIISEHVVNNSVVRVGSLIPASQQG